jgi:hypothetical protein
MSDTSHEYEGSRDSAAEAADARAERKRWGPKVWKRLGFAGLALIAAATLPAIAPAVAGWLAAPLAYAGVPGMASIATLGAGASTAALTAESAAGVAFAANWLAPAIGLAGGVGLLSAIRPGAKYAAALGR